MLSPIKLAGRKIALTFAKYQTDRLHLEFDIAISEHDGMSTINKLNAELQNAYEMLERIKKFYGIE